MPSQRATRQRRVPQASLACYGVALFLPGLAAAEANSFGFTGYSGFACLLGGAFTVLGSATFFVPWTANLPYAVAVLVWGVSARPSRLCAVLSLTALALAATVFRIDSVLVNEAGHRVAAHPGAGAWFWLAAQAIVLFGFLTAPAPSERADEHAAGAAPVDARTIGAS